MFSGIKMEKMRHVEMITGIGGGRIIEKEGGSEFNCDIW
jgi:hypothetical protein